MRIKRSGSGLLFATRGAQSILTQIWFKIRLVTYGFDPDDSSATVNSAALKSHSGPQESDFDVKDKPLNPDGSACLRITRSTFQ